MQVAVDEGTVTGENQVMLEFAVDDDGHGERGGHLLRMALIGGECTREGGQTGNAGGG